VSFRTFSFGLSTLFIACTLAGAAENIDVKQHGAVGDGKTLDTIAIQKAIDQANAAGGGIVNLPAGKFVVGTILLKDNVTLHLDDNAELLGTDDLSQYKNVDPFKDGLGAEVGYAMVAAVDAKNVTIEGKGTINGNGKAVAAAKSFKGEGWGFRPFLVRIVRCDGVKLHDVKLYKSASWTTNFFQSKNVDVQRVTIDSVGNPHNDGFDIDSCENVSINDCDVTSGDDALCLKSTGATPCRNITADNCKLKSNQGAIKLGTESYGGFENVNISNCQIRDTNNGGIKILCVDGGTLQNVTVSDITMDNVKTPIFVRLGARLKSFREGDKKKEPGVLRNVTIRNVRAKAAANAQIMPPSGIFITGIPDHRIEGLTLANIEIELSGGGTKDDAAAVVDEKIDTYPEINRFGKKLPAYGIFARHVNGLNLTDIRFKLASPDLRPAILCEDVESLQLHGIDEASVTRR
jgi:polygalacturonase